MRSAISLSAVVLLLTACSDDIAGPVRASLNQPQFAASTVDLVGRCETSFVFTGPASLEISSVCQLSGIGRVTGVSQQQLAFTQSGIVITNTTTYTTPSGDELYATFEGVGFPDGPTVSLAGTEIYTGGTGRLANAYGSATVTGSANVISSTGQYTTSGTITR